MELWDAATETLVVKAAVQAKYHWDPQGVAPFIWPGSALVSSFPGGMSRTPASSRHHQYGQLKNAERGQVGDQMWRTWKAFYLQEQMHLKMSRLDGPALKIGIVLFCALLSPLLWAHFFMHCTESFIFRLFNALHFSRFQNN